MITELARSQSRRYFLQGTGVGLGAAALATLLNDDRPAAAQGGGLGELPHFAARAKRVIYLFQSGAPSQMDLFDHKPGLRSMFGADLPDSVRRGQRLTGMTATQDRFPIAPSKYRFRQHGRSGATISELMPRLAGVA